MKKKFFTILCLSMFLVFPILEAGAFTVGPDNPYNDVIQVDYLGSLILDFDFAGFETDMVEVTLGAYGLGPDMEPAVYGGDSDVVLNFPVASFFDEFEIFGRVVMDGARFIPIGRTDFRVTVPLSTEYHYELMIQHVGRIFDTAAAQTRDYQVPFAAVNLEMSAQSAPVPEPATMLLLGTGLVGIAGIRRKMKK